MEIGFEEGRRVGYKPRFKIDGIVWKFHWSRVGENGGDGL